MNSAVVYLIGLVVGAFRAAVLHPLKDLEAARHDPVGFPALDMGDEADAARIVLVGGAVKAVSLVMGIHSLCSPYSGPPFCGQAYYNNFSQICK